MFCPTKLILCVDFWAVCSSALIWGLNAVKDYLHNLCVQFPFKGRLFCCILLLMPASSS